ncbi:MAG: hypothetical protein ACREFG_11070, partial [Chthoniobacterales bacterium]
MTVEAAVDWVGFSCASLHDFIVAQHAMHAVFWRAGKRIAHCRTGACGTRSSAETSKAATVTRLNIMEASNT